MTTPSVQQLALSDLDQELASTRRILERVPDAHWDWRPHAKSRPLGALASHVAGVVRFQNVVLRGDSYDFLASGPPPAPTANNAELMAFFAAAESSVRGALAGLTDESWRQAWELRRGDHVVFRLPRYTAVRTVGLNHLIHHRGQLSVYLRLLDVPVPGMYGPSADD